MDDNTFKYIIIIGLVAIVAIGGVSAFFFINNLNTATENITLSDNQTVNDTSQNSSDNQSTVVTKTQKTDEQKNITNNNKKNTANSDQNLISAQEAINNLKQYSGYYYGDFSAVLVQNGNKPYYAIDVYTDGICVGGGAVDARTGAILEAHG